MTSPPPCSAPADTSIVIDDSPVCERPRNSTIRLSLKLYLIRPLACKCPCNFPGVRAGNFLPTLVIPAFHQVCLHLYIV